MSTHKRQNDTAITRRAIQAEAARLVEKGGVSALSMSKIAATLQMTHGNIYRHFPSKGALAAEIAAGWMAEMRAACEAAIAGPSDARSRLYALVRAIRSELMRRADREDALAIYHYVLKHKPDDAIAHHVHRRDLIVQIMTDAGWPKDEETNLQALVILDGLRFFTDPETVAAHRDADMTTRLEKLVAVLGTYIEQNAAD
ncbi:MAG: TetR/AcrR family transcriptional regulator [Pseudomonadota bacterium]